MYHPYFRGKQNELITIRENASILAKAKFIPIIEPVKESLGGLTKALKAVCQANGQAVVLINPHHGDHSSDGAEISSMLKDEYVGKAGIEAGILLKKSMTTADVMTFFNGHKDHPCTLVHAGFIDGKGLAEALGAELPKIRHVFTEENKLYQRHFKNATRVLIRDGFKKQRNRDYEPVEFFSNLHITYADEGMNGFGDFLTVGDEFLEGGGPAYAIAIHLTFIDPDQDDAMYVYHFVSDRVDTPTDPAGKFAEALAKLVAQLDAPNSKILKTNAALEFKEIFENQHFPGLGYVKKLSMQHHIETLADYFK
ncbi:MAG: sce7725 family protein [Asticcacaulis sp.]|uniref:sce7725 family protein n=1 Tax=Asticcacaulis sp. TaxID=1872648 RepID=UPI003F7C8D74